MLLQASIYKNESEIDWGLRRQILGECSFLLLDRTLWRRYWALKEDWRLFGESLR